MHSPIEECLEVVYRILKYLKGAPSKGLFFGKRGHMQIEAYIDADCIGSNKDRRSTFGYYMFVGGKT